MTQPTAGLVCPNGHTSEESDYCSVCGAPMPGAAPAAPVADRPPTAPAGPVCPSCGTPRADPQARFCEVCRYDYLERAPGPPPVVVDGAPPAPAPPAPEPPPPA